MRRRRERRAGRPRRDGTDAGRRRGDEAVLHRRGMAAAAPVLRRGSGRRVARPVSHPLGADRRGSSERTGSVGRRPLARAIDPRLHRGSKRADRLADCLGRSRAVAGPDEAPHRRVQPGSRPRAGPGGGAGGAEGSTSRPPRGIATSYAETAVPNPYPAPGRPESRCSATSKRRSIQAPPPARLRRSGRAGTSNSRRRAAAIPKSMPRC